MFFEIIRSWKSKIYWSFKMRSMIILMIRRALERPMIHVKHANQPRANKVVIDDKAKKRQQHQHQQWQLAPPIPKRQNQERKEREAKDIGTPKDPNQ